VFPRFESLAKSKISQFDFPIAEEDILGLDVSVHDVISIKHFESFE